MTDHQFILALSEDELTDALLEELDVRMCDADFVQKYDLFMNEKYSRPLLKILADYIPFILFTVLIVIGLYLLS